MKFSLIVATKGRTAELERLFDSLVRQTFRDFEIILADQNEDNRLAPYIQQFADRLAIKHVRPAVGISRARNRAFADAQGEIIGFPDDDCWYDATLLERVAAFFESHPQEAGLSVRCVDQDGNGICVWWSRKPGPVRKLNAWFRCTSVGMFLRRSVVEALGGFDETLGVGSGTQWPSSEDIDLMIRAVAEEHAIHYEPSLAVFHPPPIQRYDAAAIRKALEYGLATGHVLRKHRYPLWFVACALLHPVAMLPAAFLRGGFPQARTNLAALRGRAAGWADLPAPPPNREH